MTKTANIYIAVGLATFLALGIFGGAALSDHKIATLQDAVESEKQKAASIEHEADDAERRAAEYKQKIEYLTQQIGEIQAIARNQDEELEKLNGNSSHARSDVERSKRIRAIAAGHDELCAKLAELGHSCE